LHLLAHEVAHTVQQDGATPTLQHKLEVSSPGDADELEADHAADAMVAGLPVDGLSRAASASRPARIRRDPRIESQRQGRLVRYRVTGWSVDWQAILARVAARADLQPFTRAFTVADLVRGHASHPITLADGRTVTFDLANRQQAGREGETRRVGPGHVSSTFNRGADLEAALGVPPGGLIPAQAVTDANANRRQLQQRLDSQVFEVLVHELSHALVIFESEAPQATNHSATYQHYDALQRASNTGAAATAARAVDVEVQTLITDLVNINVADPTENARVLAAVRAHPQLAPQRVRDWFIDERAARDASDAAAGTTMNNATLGPSYSERLSDFIRGRIQAEAHLQHTSASPSSALGARVQAWLDATVDGARAAAANPSAAPPPAANPSAPPPAAPSGPAGDAGSVGVVPDAAGAPDGAAGQRPGGGNQMPWIDAGRI
jgi:hypothetical protein